MLTFVTVRTERGSYLCVVRKAFRGAREALNAGFARPKLAHVDRVFCRFLAVIRDGASYHQYARVFREVVEYCIGNLAAHRIEEQVDAIRSGLVQTLRKLRLAVNDARVGPQCRGYGCRFL